MTGDIMLFRYNDAFVHTGTAAGLLKEDDDELSLDGKDLKPITMMWRLWGSKKKKYKNSGIFRDEIK